MRPLCSSPTLNNRRFREVSSEPQGEDLCDSRILYQAKSLVIGDGRNKVLSDYENSENVVFTNASLSNYF